MTGNEAYLLLEKVECYLQEHFEEDYKITLSKAEIENIRGEADSIVNLCHRMERLSKI